MSPVFGVHLSHKNKEATFNMIWLDSTAIKVHRHGAGALKKTECNP